MTLGGRSAVRIALDQLRDNPLRAGLSTLGVVMGVAALVAVLSVGDGVERFARAKVARSTSVQTVAVQALVTREVDGLAVPVPDPPIFTAADAAGLTRTLPAGTAVDLSSLARDSSPIPV